MIRLFVTSLILGSLALPGGRAYAQSPKDVVGTYKLIYETREQDGTRTEVKTNGRLVLDEPTTLPEGAVLDLVLDDEGDDLTDADREALHGALTRSLESLDKGDIRPASTTIDELRTRR